MAMNDNDPWHWTPQLRRQVEIGRHPHSRPALVDQILPAITPRLEFFCHVSVKRSAGWKRSDEIRQSLQLWIAKPLPIGSCLQLLPVVFLRFENLQHAPFDRGESEEDVDPTAKPPKQEQDSYNQAHI